MVRKATGRDRGQLYAMKVLKKAVIVRKKKVMEHTLTERSVLEAIRDFPFLVTLHYAFQTNTKLHLIMGEPPHTLETGFIHFGCLSSDYVCGGEMFSHLHLIGPFPEDHARIYAAEITLALEHLHSVSQCYI